MEESTTYQYILEKGALREARKMLLLGGAERFGPLDQTTKTRVEGIDNLERLEHLQVRLMKVSSWEELLS